MSKIIPISKDVSALTVTEIVRNAKIAITSALIEETSGMSRNQTKVALAHARKLGFITMIGNVRSAEYCLPGRERAAIEEAKRRQRAATKDRQDRFKAKQKDKPKIGQANRKKEAVDRHKKTASDIKSLLNRGPMTRACIISELGISSYGFSCSLKFWEGIEQVKHAHQSSAYRIALTLEEKALEPVDTKTPCGNTVRKLKEVGTGNPPKPRNQKEEWAAFASMR